jgi:hypothetical protein
VIAMAAVDISEAPKHLCAGTVTAGHLCTQLCVNASAVCIRHLRAQLPRSFRPGRRGAFGAERLFTHERVLAWRIRCLACNSTVCEVHFKGW